MGPPIIDEAVGYHQEALETTASIDTSKINKLKVTVHFSSYE